ncbi:hypothetical protein [Nitrososphaera sp.]|uniref:hypothetical protein n=1 Tax=Nitrososphaera sp. TaxID=1971748 RepID=UPI002EDB374F
MSQVKSLAIVVAIAAAISVVVLFVSLPRDQNAPGLAQNDSDSPLGSSNVPAAKNVVYTAKFECGTISGEEGPLRPGHYDTDIGILNKQDFGVQFTWTAVVNDGRTTHPVLMALEPQTSIGIVCDNLRQLVGDEKFVEGFVIIDVPMSGQLFSESTAVVGRQGETIDILDVQVFYTANALEELSHEILVDKIVFAIESDPSGKVPQEMIGRTLDMTVRSGLDEISDPAEKVRNVIAGKYDLSEQEAADLKIKIEMVSVGAGTMIDDHALSLSRVPPQARG